jgi:hypothetical protein
VKTTLFSNEVRGSNEARWALGIRMSRKDIAIRNKKQRIGNKEACSIFNAQLSMFKGEK